MHLDDDPHKREKLQEQQEQQILYPKHYLLGHMNPHFFIQLC